MEQLTLAESHKKADAIFRKAYLCSKKREESLVVGSIEEEGLFREVFSYRLIKAPVHDGTNWAVYVAERDSLTGKATKYIMRADLNQLFKTRKEAEAHVEYLKIRTDI